MLGIEAQSDVKRGGRRTRLVRSALALTLAGLLSCSPSPQATTRAESGGVAVSDVGGDVGVAGMLKQLFDHMQQDTSIGHRPALRIA